MPDTPRCQQCGTPLPGGALAGLCPACLLQQGVAPDSFPDESRPGFTPPAVEELAPLFPQLEILELIGKGGMGAVYKARQKQLDRFVALKILPPGIGTDPAFAERFAREAKALARLSHPGIVTLYEFGAASGSPPPSAAPPAPLYFFLMEFVDGVNLRQLLAHGRISPREALAVVPQICDALQYAHDQGIVHRDIKPENILLDRRGRVKVADFGLAKIVAQETCATEPGARAGGGGASGVPATLTDAGKVMGTPQYMSPEQIEAPGEVDHRADIYAVGVVFYQMLTGELPGKPLLPPSRKVRIDVRLDEVVLRALEQRPELRYQQASVLKTRVETIATSTRSSPDPVRWPAIGLITASLLSPFMLGLVIQTGHLKPGRWMLVPLLLELALVAVTALGGFKLLHLESRRMAIIGGIAGCVLSFFNFLVLPFAVWALAVCGRREVREAFQRGGWPPPEDSVRPAPGTNAGKIAVVALLIFAGVVLIAGGISLFLLPLHSRAPRTLLPGHEPAEGDASTSLALLNKQPSSAAGFGPVIERLIAGEGDAARRFIDLDTGKLSAAAEFFDLRSELSPLETQRWWRNTGIDAMGDTSPAVRGLTGFEMTAVPVPGEEWQQAGPPRLDYYFTLSTAGTPATMSGKGDLPATFAFKTREGAKGLLQIVGFTTDQRGVNVRYKLAEEHTVQRGIR